jgi:exonuclease III
MKNKSVKASSILRLACWNIDGLYQRIDGQRLCKLQYPEFQQEVLDIDILGLVETHVGSKESLILPGYKIFLNHRPKAKKSPNILVD